MQYELVAYGHILDEKIMYNLWREFERELVPDRFDIKSIRITLPSSLTCRSKAGRSRLRFIVESHDSSSAETRSHKIAEFLESHSVSVIYCEPAETLKPYKFQLTGHIIEDDLMDRISEQLSKLGVDPENVVISYPSSFLGRNRAIPSTVKFRLIGTEAQIAKIPEALSKCQSDYSSASKGRFDVFYMQDNISEHHIRIWGHILDSGLIGSLGDFVRQGAVDAKSVDLSYPSASICCNRKERSLLSFDLWAENFIDASLQIEEICKKHDSELVMSIPKENFNWRRCEISGHIIERNILDRLSERIFSESLSRRRIDISRINISYASVSQCADFRNPSQLDFYVEFDKNIWSPVAYTAFQSIEQDFDAKVVFKELTYGRKDGQITS
ncbi:MAG: hypothetical protein ACFFER_13105 [Candidatus Thorarchaeota archaeon]